MRIGIAGTGKIVHEVLPVMTGLDGMEVTALFGRPHSEATAIQLAQEYHIPHVFTDYDALLQCEEVDVVYVALANSAHFDYSLRALRADKSVVVEKPACLFLHEWETLVSEAQQRGLFLFEAVTLLHMPNFELLQQQLLPRIGRIRMVTCNYSQRSSRYDRYLRGDVAPAFDPQAGGGALMDLNVYNLHFVTALFGEPQRAEYFANRGPNGVDTSGTALLGFDHLQATCIAAKDSDAPSFGLIQGEEGWIRVEGSVSTMSEITLCHQGRAETFNLHGTAHRMSYELEHFRQLFSTGQPEMLQPYTRVSTAVMRTLARLR